MNPERRYTFKCPTCEKEFTYEQPGEPLCDGPGEVRSHEPAVMRLILIWSRDRERIISPEEGERRAKGILLTPETIVAQRLRIEGKLWTPEDGINPWTGEEMVDE